MITDKDIFYVFIINRKFQKIDQYVQKITPRNKFNQRLHYFVIYFCIFDHGTFITI